MNNGLGENLIFLISQPRAGSTLLQRILAGHPEIHAMAEPWIMLHPLYALKRKGYSAEYDTHQARYALDDFCQTLNEGEEAYIKAVRQMGLYLYDCALAGTGKTYFLDKTPRYYFIIPELYRVFPRASYIFLLRNPLAVLSSILHTWIGGDWHRLALHRHDLLKAPQLLVNGFEHLKDDAIVVRYEDLVTNPEQIVQLLCEKLQMEFYPAILEYGQNPAPKGRMGDAVGVRRHTRPVADYVDKWIGCLASPRTRYLAEVYLSALGPELLSRLGYSFEKLHRDLLSVECQGEPLDEGSMAEILSPLGLRPVRSFASSAPSSENISASTVALSDPARQAGPPSPNEDRSTGVLVSAIVSTYNAERFIRGCLEDLEAQTIADRIEIIVVDSGSQQNERAVVEEFQRRYDNIVYLRTEEREGVYAAWNRGIKAAHGKYITNANTDDRHRADAFERMAEVLEARPDIALVYANLYITETENETFENHTPVGAFRWLDFDPLKLIYGCFIGPQPMWRKSLHDKYGYFDESFESAGDWEFWLRIAEKEKFLHLDEFLGLYLKSPTSVEHRNHDLSVREARRVHQRYLPRLARRRPEPFDRAQACTERSRSDSPVEGLPAQWPADSISDFGFRISEYSFGNLQPVASQETTLVTTPTTTLVLSAGGAHQPQQLARCLEHLQRFRPASGGLTVRVVNAGTARPENGLDRREAPEPTPAAALRVALASEARYVALLSPDVVVTKGWLDNLLAVADSEPSVAAVGPTSNAAPAPQRIKQDYRSLKKELQKFAARRARGHKEAWDEVPYLGGFCLLLKRQAVQQVGGLDDRLPLPEALWDLYSRLRASGFKLACARAAYVHHDELTADEGADYDHRAAAEEAVRELFAAGKAALERGDLEAAAGEFEHLTRQAPGLAAGHTALGSTLMVLGRVEEAIPALRRAAELVPQEPALHNQLGTALYQLGEFEAAEEAFRAALGAAPADPSAGSGSRVDALLNLIEVYRAQGRYVEATECVKGALGAAPDDVAVLTAFGTLSLELGDAEAARTALQHLQAIDPDQPVVRTLQQALIE